MSPPSPTKRQLDEQPRHLTFSDKLTLSVSRNKRWWIGGGTIFLLTIILVAATREQGKESNHVWTIKTPNTQLETATHVEFCGTCEDRLVVAGTSAGDSAVEIFDVDENDNWQLTVTFAVQNQIASIAVSDSGTRIAVAASDTESNTHFFVFEETHGGTWNQYGHVIETEELFGSSDALSVSAFARPTVKLSSNGRIMVLTLQPVDTSQNLEQEVHILKDVDSLDGTIGQVWKRLGEPIVDEHTGDHGNFGTFVALSGSGDKLIIAAEDRLLSAYELQGEEWLLRAENDESPLVGTGSLALSRDGSTLAVGSYDRSLQGTGELYIVKSGRPWFLVDDDKDQTTMPYDSSTTSIEVSLSGTGDHLLVGRFSASGNTSFNVYKYDDKEHDWVSTNGSFGQMHSTMKGTVGISDDARRVAAAVDGKLFVYEFSS